LGHDKDKLARQEKISRKNGKITCLPSLGGGGGGGEGW
jgi:hypothetical protein